MAHERQERLALDGRPVLAGLDLDPGAGTAEPRFERLQPVGDLGVGDGLGFERRKAVVQRGADVVERLGDEVGFVALGGIGLDLESVGMGVQGVHDVHCFL